MWAKKLEVRNWRPKMISWLVHFVTKHRKAQQAYAKFICNKWKKLFSLFNQQVLIPCWIPDIYHLGNSPIHINVHLWIWSKLTSKTNTGHTDVKKFKDAKIAWTPLAQKSGFLTFLKSGQMKRSSFEHFILDGEGFWCETVFKDYILQSTNQPFTNKRKAMTRV